MNRSLAQWLAGNPVGAVLVTGLLGLLPLFGVGVAFFLPGAVPALVGDIGRLFLGSLVLVGLAAAHRAVSQGKLAVAWLWVTYALLVLVAPFAVIGLAALGFVDNWLRSQPPARSAAT